MSNITNQKQILIEKFLRSDHPLKSKLNANDRILLFILASYMGNKDNCWPSYKSLIKDTGIASRTTIYKSLAKLEYFKIIKIEYHFKTNNEYFLHQEFEKEVVQICTTQLQICTTPSTDMDTNNINNKIINNLYSNTENQTTSANNIVLKRMPTASLLVEEYMENQRNRQNKDPTV